MYFRTRSGCSRTASLNEQKMIPISASVCLECRGDGNAVENGVDRDVRLLHAKQRRCSPIGTPSFS